MKNKLETWLHDLPMTVAFAALFAIGAWAGFGWGRGSVGEIRVVTITTRAAEVETPPYVKTGPPPATCPAGTTRPDG